jgi:hypothetical protein
MHSIAANELKDAGAVMRDVKDVKVLNERLLAELQKDREPVRGSNAGG